MISGNCFQMRTFQIVISKFWFLSLIFNVLAVAGHTLFHGFKVFAVGGALRDDVLNVLGVEGACHFKVVI